VEIAVMKGLISAFVFTLALAAAPPDPVAWKITDCPVKPVNAGTNFSVTVMATVTPGWRIYSTKSVARGPTATRVWVNPGQPFPPAGIIRATTPHRLQDPAFNKEMEAYEDEAQFFLPLRVPFNADTGSQMLVVRLTYQACNDKTCLPPKTVRIAQAIEITRPSPGL
jgi:thiol:disulfide interchange protein DsbD